MNDHEALDAVLDAFFEQPGPHSLTEFRGDLHTVLDAATQRLDVGALHHALLRIESGLTYAVDEGKYIEAASLIAAEYARVKRGTE
jgi:hypothetical protein